MTQDRTGSGGSSRCQLANSPKLADLPTPVIHELERICQVRRFEAGQVVIPAGEASSFVGCVDSGILRMEKTLPDGEEHIVGLLVEGDMFGHVFNGPLNFAIEAATDATIFSFRHAPFEALLARSPELERLMLLSVLNELDRARDWMMILGNHRVEGRLAGFLLVLCTRFLGKEHVLSTAGGGIELRIPISRADIAHLLGTRPETISRAVHALADRDIISIKDPARFVILDIEALIALSGEANAEDIEGLQALLTALGKTDR